MWFAQISWFMVINSQSTHPKISGLILCNFSFNDTFLLSQFSESLSVSPSISRSISSLDINLFWQVDILCKSRILVIKLEQFTTAIFDLLWRDPCYKILFSAELMKKKWQQNADMCILEFLDWYHVIIHQSAPKCVSGCGTGTRDQ